MLIFQDTATRQNRIGDFDIVVRQGDDQWFNIIKWVHIATVNAEELGVTMANVEEMKGSDNPAIKRVLGTEGNFGESIGLDADWAAKAISAVGNYGEIFDRNVGPDTPLGIARGVNALWTKGARALTERATLAHGRLFLGAGNPNAPAKGGAPSNDPYADPYQQE